MKRQAKAFYQPWDHDAFLSGARRKGLTYIQIWMYDALLHEAFTYDTRPYLPDDDNILWHLAGCKSKSQWLENMIAVRSCFDVKRKISGQSVLSHHRILQDWERITNERKQLSQAGHEGGLRSALKRRLSPAAPSLQPSSSEAQAVREVSKKERKEERKEEGEAPCFSSFSPEEEMALEQLYRQMVAAWKEVHGESAICPYPTFPEEKLAWKVLIGNHSHELLLQAFQLWAKEQADQGITERFPLGKFVRVADKYMQKIVPLKTAGVIDKIEATARQQQMEEAKRKREEILKASEAEELGAGPEEYA